MTDGPQPAIKLNLKMAEAGNTLGLAFAVGFQHKAFEDEGNSGCGLEDLQAAPRASDAGTENARNLR